MRRRRQLNTVSAFQIDMTIEAPIERTTRRIHKEFYAERDLRFWQDFRPLVKAITKYGYECNQRGWEMQPHAIYWDISRLLDSMRKHKDDIEYLPAYLESTVRNHVGMRAEEIQALSNANRTSRAVRVITDGVRPVVEVISTDTQLLAALHASLLKHRSKAKPHRQLQLL